MADAGRIRAHIARYYDAFFSRAAPNSSLPILTGRGLAQALSYPLTLLSSIPESLWERFLPCGNPFPYIEPEPGERILNLGCGVGIDSQAIRCLNPFPLTIIGVDIACEALRQAFRTQPEGLRWLCADGTALPFAEGSFQWVLMNGAFNLFAEKGALLAEIRRVLLPGGGLVCADLCRSQSSPMEDYWEEELDAWAWCMSGALTEAELTARLQLEGFTGMEIFPQEAEEMLYRVVFRGRKSTD